MSNTKEDIKRLQERAEAGDAAAQNSLGCAYHNADDVARDYAKAREWYLRAAAQKESYAQNNLGQVYLYGNGVTANTGQALRWFKKSALNGNQYGLLHLAEMYENGKGVEKDIMTAYKLYGKSAAIGNVKAKEKVKTLRNLYDKNVDIRLITCPLVSKNIFRILGLYVNSSVREISAHKAKLRTFISVGKKATFEIDNIAKCLYPNIFPHEVPLFEELYRDGLEEPYASMSLSHIYESIAKKNAQLHTLSKTEIYYKYIKREKICEEELSYDDRRVLSNIKDLQKHLSDLQFAYDYKRNLLITPCREKDNCNSASNEMEDCTQKLKYAFFWFAYTTETDRTAFDCIKNKDVEKAFTYWSEADGYSSLLNAAVLSFLKGDNDTYVECITDIIHTAEYRDDFIKAVCGDNCRIKEEELAHLFIDTLLSNMPDENWLSIFKRSGVSANDDEYIENKLVSPTVKELDDIIKNAKNIRFDKSSVNNYAVLISLKEKIFDCLDDFTDIIRNKEDYRYCIICDKACEIIISLSQLYYRACNTSEYDCTSHCVELSEYALSLAHGAVIKSRAEEAYEEIKALYKGLPRREVFDLFIKIRNLIDDCKSNGINNLDDARKLVELCAPHINEIKERTGKSNESYIKISTEVVECALAIMIDVFNTDFEKFDTLVEKKKGVRSIGNVNFYGAEIRNYLQHLKEMLKDCCALFANLNLFDIDAHYADRRFIKNKDSILRQSREFGIDPNCYLPDIDLRGDDETFISCKTQKDYEMYVKFHPHGKHIHEAGMRIAKIKEEKEIEDKCWEECKSRQTYMVYLQHYPQGRYASTAHQKEVQESEAEYWNECKKHSAYKAYLRRYPQGHYAKNAREAKNELDDKNLYRIILCVVLCVISMLCLAIILSFNGNNKGEAFTPSETGIENKSVLSEEEVPVSDAKEENSEYNDIGDNDNDESLNDDVDDEEADNYNGDSDGNDDNYIENNDDEY